jgi:protein gp37
MFEKRMSISDLRKRKGIVGIVQHGDLFWSKVPERVIHAILDIVDETATLKKGGEKYLLWTKRAQRMSEILTNRYRTLPEYLGVAVTVEDQKTADERLPFMAGFGGMKAIVIEPQLEEITLERHLDGISWVIEGSETGRNARPFNLDWARKVRDETKARDIPFFIKQMGNDHKHQERVLDTVAWTEFPHGWIK